MPKLRNIMHPNPYFHIYEMLQTWALSKSHTKIINIIYLFFRFILNDSWLLKHLFIYLSVLF